MPFAIPPKLHRRFHLQIDISSLFRSIQTDLLSRQRLSADSNLNKVCVHPRTVRSHSQAVLVLISLLRSGSLGVKRQAATGLGSLCKEKELRVKVLLGECIPPLLGLLKSSSVEGQIAAVQAGGVDVLVKLLTSGKSSTVSNVCFHLACMMMEDASVCSSVLTADIIKQLLKLLGSGNEASVRAEAAAALKSLSAQSKEAKREVANSNGIPILINATIALASALMIYDGKAETTRASDPLVFEQTLLKQSKPRLPFLIQERTIEALESLYGNSILSVKLSNSDAKRLLTKIQHLF
ncbi:unnamed protein product [Eruca vesicaria subsp. sativa]|uniref:ARM repeat superfamily protein n=1 Tax=Eruca vesicaria subsp. sativa TaxID=29727 RepID=A0ABC8IRU6_ERUVS|nr:unnamed protein product [Eruca vesicaria subsp. sativa]